MLYRSLCHFPGRVSRRVLRHLCPPVPSDQGDQNLTEWVPVFTLMCAPCSLTRADCSLPALGLMLLCMTARELPPTWSEYESIASLAPEALTLFYLVRSSSGHSIVQSASPQSLVSLTARIPTAGFTVCWRGCPQESKEGLQPHFPHWQSQGRQKLCLTGVWVLLTPP